jgi:hypothetical protein
MLRQLVFLKFEQEHALQLDGTLSGIGALGHDSQQRFLPQKHKSNIHPKKFKSHGLDWELPDTRSAGINTLSKVVKNKMYPALLY